MAHLELNWIGLVAAIIGLALGIMWRAGRMRKKGEKWAAIKDDLFVSVLTSGLNIACVIWLIEYLEAEPLLALVIGGLAGALGTGLIEFVLETGEKMLRNHFGDKS